MKFGDAAMISFPPFRLDMQGERLWKNGAQVRLRRKPFALLKHLVTNPQRLVTHAELVEAVWGKTIATSDSLVRTHMHELRHALGEGFLETVVGRGYRFLVAVDHGDLDTESEGSGAQAAPKRPLLVARGTHLEAIHGAFREARERRRGVVFVGGDAGAGKTTLVDAFVEQVRLQGNPWIARGACVERHGSGESFLPIFEALAGLCRGRNHRRVVEALVRHAPTWVAQIPDVAGLPQARDVARGALGATHPHMIHELALALDALGADAPVILTLDDLQWADSSTLDLLAVLTRRIEPARLLIVGAYRHALARAHPLQRLLGELVARRNATDVVLEPFDADALSDYLVARYPNRCFPSSFPLTIHHSTGGNPLFLVTLLDDLEKRGMIRQFDGQWMLDASVEDVAAHRPQCVRRLIDAQIDRLALPAQRILEAAGVAGLTFTAGVLAHVFGEPVDAVDSTCETLANEHRLLRYVGTETWPDGTVQSRYAFAHTLFQHAAIGRCTAATTRNWHRLIGERLESGYGPRASEIVAEVAFHYEQAQMPPQALDVRRDAGVRLTNGCEASEVWACAGHE